LYLLIYKRSAMCSDHEISVINIKLVGPIWNSAVENCCRLVGFRWSSVHDWTRIDTAGSNGRITVRLLPLGVTASLGTHACRLTRHLWRYVQQSTYTGCPKK